MDTVEAADAPSPTREWHRHWHQPIIGMMGLSGAAIFTYSAGVFMVPMTGQFGWSRAEYSFGLTLWSMCGLVTAPILGRLVDAFGPRKIAIIGVICAIAYYSAMGAIGGNIWQWWLVCAGLSLVLPMLSPTVWIAAVRKCFTGGRGLAFAVALSGSGLAAAIWPAIAAQYYSLLGWRLAYPAMAISWGLVLLPAVVLFFDRRKDGDPGPTAADKPTGDQPGYTALLLSRTFLLLAIAGSSFAMMTLAMTVHMVPILGDNGIGLAAAATIAGIIGVCSIVGRIVTGALLDRFSVALIGPTAFLMPIVSSLILFLGGGQASAVVAVVFLGLAHGAEIDVITYIAARRFDARRFASIYSVLIALFTAGAGLGPILA